MDRILPFFDPSLSPSPQRGQLLLGAWTKTDIFWTPSPPHLVHVVIECPLSRSSYLIFFQFNSFYLGNYCTNVFSGFKIIDASTKRVQYNIAEQKFIWWYIVTNAFPHFSVLTFTYKVIKNYIQGLTPLIKLILNLVWRPSVPLLQTKRITFIKNVQRICDWIFVDIARFVSFL